MLEITVKHLHVARPCLSARGEHVAEEEDRMRAEAACDGPGLVKINVMQNLRPRSLHVRWRADFWIGNEEYVRWTGRRGVQLSGSGTEITVSREAEGYR